MKKIAVSVPGKMILIGEHSGVYGKPMLITSVGCRMKVVIQPHNDKIVGIHFNNKTYKRNLDLIAKDYEQAEKQHGIYEKSLQVTDLKKIAKKIEDYPFLIVGKFIIDQKVTIGFDISIDSQIPIQSGFGSSAAVAVGITGALDLFFNKKINKKRVFEYARHCERFKHGFPSGGDVAGVLYGKIVWFEKREAPFIKPLKITIPKKINDSIVLINTDVPVESTGEMVANVRGLLEKEKDAVTKIFEDQGKLTREVLKNIEDKDLSGFIKTIKKAGQNLEKIGVASPIVKQFIRKVEDAGGAAKICGGGGVKKGTGIVLTVSPNTNEIKKIAKTFKFEVIDVELGPPGLKIEYDSRNS